MKLTWQITYCCLLVLGTYFTTGISKTVHHLEDRKFASEEYLDPEIDERDSGSEPSSYISIDQPAFQKPNFTYPLVYKYPDKLDPNIRYDHAWHPNVRFGQISAVSIDPNGNIGIFHRGDRKWDSQTFNNDNTFSLNKGAIRDNTIILVNKNAEVLLEWGWNMFYLPHGLTIDSLGNYWVTDVAMHQVFKFDGVDLEKHKQKLYRERFEHKNFNENVDINNLFANSVLKPSLSLGEPFKPGNDQFRFCKPTAVAVQKNGDFFVSDGYCNSRIIKFNKNGERILEWGRPWGFPGNPLYQSNPPPNAFLVPHALALSEDHDYIFVADRENGRVESFYASNGSFHKQYQSPMLGGQIYSVAYAQGQIYLVNGMRPFDNDPVHIRGFILDVKSGEVVSQFAPTVDLNNPHDIAVTADGSEIYIVELNNMKVYRFVQNIYKIKSRYVMDNTTGVHTAPLSENSGKTQEKNPKNLFLVTVVILGALIMIGLCILSAAVLAKYQKRGALFASYRRKQSRNDDKDSYKFSNLLDNKKKYKIFEKRPNTRDFSKVNTEPETSDEENIELSLEKIV